MHRLTAEEEEESYQIANSKRFRGMTPAQIAATLAGEGTYAGSVSTLYRIVRKRRALEHRRQSKKPRAARPAHTYYVSAPDQVYAWDIARRVLGLHNPSEMASGARS